MSTNNEDNVNYKVKAKKSISIEIKKQAIDDVVTGISHDAIMQKYKFRQKKRLYLQVPIRRHHSKKI